MAIKVDQDKCVGCGLCVSLCPDTFRLNSGGKSEVFKQGNTDCAQQAVASCPAAAISIK